MIDAQPNRGPGQVCPGCGRPVKPGASEGLCAGCLLGRAMELAGEAQDPGEGGDLLAPSGLEGRTLGGYEILSTIAQGGMGVVFRARQRNPSRVVALKVISAGELATRRMVERFQNEALAAARLNHPNIVPILEVGEDRGWHFFSMRLIEGRTLADLIREGRPDPCAAVSLLLKVARAVEHAHQRGILHRDLKPTNILLDAAGEPHLTDFGLAKVTERDSDLTLSHAVLGTPAYMSPEQASGRNREITTATDVYGLGAVLYEFLGGRPPFSAEGTPALLRKISEEEPRPLKWESGTNGCGSGNGPHFARPAADFEDLSVICLKCLEKSPARRYATARELAEELERWQRHEPILARPAGAWERTAKWVRRNRALAALAGTIVLAGFVLTLVSLLFNLRLDRARDSAVKAARQSHDQLVREHLREAGRATAAGDGLTGLFALTDALGLEQGAGEAESAIRLRLGLTLRSAPELLRLWDAGGRPFRMQFSDDNHRLTVVRHDGTLLGWDLRDGTGTVYPRPQGESSYGVVFSPTGRQAAQSLPRPPFVRLHGLERGTNGPLPLAEPCAGAITFSGAGRWLITGRQRLRVWEADTGREVPMADDTSGPWERIVGSPDERLILALSPDGRGRLLETGTWRWRTLTESLDSPSGPLPSFSEDGRWLALFTDGEIRLHDTATGAQVFSAPHSGLAFSAAFSPDGRFLALAGFRDQARVWALPSTEAGTNVSAFRLPIRHETGANQVLFSPDGRLLATAGFDYQLRLLGADRHQLAAPLLHHTALVETLAFSADGRFLASADAKGLVRVWDLQPRGVIALPGLAAKPTPRFTPDGKLLVGRDLSDRLRVWDTRTSAPVGEALHEPKVAAGPVEDGTNGGPRPERGAPMDLAWDAAGRHLAAALGSDGVRVWDFASRRVVGNWNQLGEVLCVAMHPDGSVLAAGTSGGAIHRWNLASGKPLEPVLSGNFPARQIVWSAGGEWLAAGGSDRLQVWDARRGTPLAEPLRLVDTLSALEFTPDGTRLLVAAANNSISPGTARLLELPSLRAVRPSMEHGDGVSAAVVSPDGRWVATGGEDNVLRLWRAPESTAMGRAMRHQGVISALAFSPSSRWLAAGGYDGYLRLWSIPGGELGGPPLPLAAALPAVGFSPDGQWMLAGSQRQNSWLVSLAPDGRPLRELERVARMQTALRPAEGGTLEQVSPTELARDFATHLPAGEVFVSHEAAMAWHEGLAAPAEASGARFTAEFHLRRLLALRPQDAALRARLERVRAAR